MLKVMDRRSFFGRALAGFAAVLGVKMLPPVADRVAGISLRYVQQWRAAGGSLRTGATLRELVDYGQNYAGEEYFRLYNAATKALTK